MKFKQLAREWRDMHASNVTDKTILNINQQLTDHLYPNIGNKEIDEITPKMLLNTLKRVERSSTFLARRLCQRCNEIFVYAGIMGYIDHNPAYGLKKYLKRHTYVNHAHLTDDDDLSDLLCNIDALNRISPANKAAFWFIVYTVARRSEATLARRDEFDLDDGLWVIPAERAKTRREQHMPLSNQTIKLLETEFDRVDSPWAFTSNQTKNGLKPIDPWSPLYLVTKAGYSTRQTMHGFRHVFSTRAHDAGFLSDAVELSLSHSIGGTKGVYNKAKMLGQRREIMQWWADLVDDWRCL